jgi:5'-deoxynucleotidase YfbR-like HD superfamily hydrolase
MMSDSEHQTTERQVNLLISGFAVKRFHTVPTIGQETVGHHSALVAAFVTLIWPEKLHLLPHALIHDVAESITGDVPSPGKRLFVDRERLKKAEGDILEAADLLLPPLSAEDQRSLKICDILAGMAACRQELRMGNHLVMEAFGNYVDYFRELGVTDPTALSIAEVLTTSSVSLD